MADYLRYENFRYAEKTGRWLIEEWVNRAHRRYYFPDITGQLYLIGINNFEAKDFWILAEDALLRDFDVSYRDLDLGATPDVPVAECLDDRCSWPPALFPEGAPSIGQKGAPAPLPELPPVTCADAWI